jgi:hypothetical protein
MSPVFGVDMGEMPKGPTTVIRAATDPVRVPEDIETVKIIQRCLCRVTLGEDCYVVQGLTGDTRTVPYGALLSKWEQVCGELLELATRSEMV